MCGTSLIISMKFELLLKYTKMCLCSYAPVRDKPQHAEGKRVDYDFQLFVIKKEKNWNFLI